MGIYIPGMEMPRSCFYCPFQHKTTTECLITHKYYNWGLTTPPSNCPIIPVPPHGRLIESKAFLQVVHKTDNFSLDELAHLAVLVAATPTIIPAEEGE